MFEPIAKKVDWIERRAADLIERARRSEWREQIFGDAREFLELGYVGDVALKMSLDYWCWDPRTAE